MKVLIDNYSQIVRNDNLCELMAAYMDREGYEVYLNSNTCPFYYKMQRFNPDWLITSSLFLQEDFWQYIESEKTNTLFIIVIDPTLSMGQFSALEQKLLASKIRYKMLVNNNFGNRGYIKLNEKNIVSFNGFQSDVLKSSKPIKWKKEFDFLVLGGQCKVDKKVLTRLREENFSFHTHLVNAENSVELTKNLSEYKDILCNYKSFVFYDNRKNGLDKNFYDICYLRKPVYLIDSPSPRATQKSLGMDVDILFENREKSNINFEEFHDNISKEFCIKKQMEKLLTHLPKRNK